MIIGIQKQENRKVTKSKKSGLKASRLKKGMSIVELRDEIFKDVPDEIWDSLPTDGAKYSHHYLYGYPKEDDR